ncbi:hypothetical protein N7495_000618 [Penicillium taxi]|uniref:uncharacterized protein n=1 Tax=Penicillium taxi TaxID=168475 RepID=UPI0025458850|nr:uncharacterized protein N7495_000618 [Penicillium taxi]KAJ5907936.1 hypothetical protein N7495_000618 [Penicillium taxi]
MSPSNSDSPSSGPPESSSPKENKPPSPSKHPEKHEDPINNPESQDHENSENPDKSISLKNVRSAKKALELLAQTENLEIEEFIVLTDVTLKLGNSRWNLLGSQYPKIRKTFLPEQGILEIKMPKWAHEVIIPWLVICDRIWNSEMGLYNAAERRDFMIYASPQIDFGQKKEPDALLISKRAPSTSPGKSPLPSIVVEIGFSQSYKSLKENARRILIGASPTAQLVILVKFFCRNPGIAIRLEVWRLNAAGIPNCDEERNIFPIQQEPPTYLRYPCRAFWIRSGVPNPKFQGSLSPRLQRPARHHSNHFSPARSPPTPMTRIFSTSTTLHLDSTVMLETY